jgi:tetratricopeptide (TPR) repeat protein
MKKTSLIFAFILLILQTSFSQTKDIKDLYFDFMQVRMDHASKSAKTKALNLLSRSAELSQNQLANINFHLGRIYEESKEPEKAIPHYINVIKSVPGYYVAHRALGYIELKKCDSLGKIVTAAAKANNAPVHAENLKLYKSQVRKTLPYLEKSQACDADERTLHTLNSLYASIKDSQSVSTLKTRLIELGKDCVSLLEDE